MLAVIFFLLAVELLIVVRYRFREEWCISKEQTASEMVAAFVLLLILIFLCNAYSNNASGHDGQESKTESPGYHNVEDAESDLCATPQRDDWFSESPWNSFPVRKPGVDFFGREIVKNDNYDPHITLHGKNYTFMPQVLQIIDGDTFILLLQYNGIENAVGTWDERIRIKDIDTPEKGQVYSKEATSRLMSLIFDRSVYVHPFSRDKYGRVLADVFTDKGENVGLILLREGFARVYSRCSRPEYYQAEAEAKKAKRGIWATE